MTIHLLQDFEIRGAMMFATTTISSSATSFLLSLILVIQILNGIFKRRRQHKFSLGKGCKAGKEYKQVDPYLGLVFLYRNIRDFRARTFLHAWQQRLDKTGRTIWVWILGSRVLVISDPENVKAVLATSSDDFERGPHMRAAFRVVANGIFAADGEHWQTSRALFRPSFARDEIHDTDRFETHFRNLLHLLPTDGRMVDLQPLLDRFAMDTATDLLFGKSTGSLTAESDEEAAKFYGSAKYCLWAIFRDWNLGLLGRILPDRTYSEAREYIYKTVDRYVRIALESNAKAVIGESSTAKPEQRKRYILLNHLAEQNKDPIMLRDQSISALVGGAETTANLLSNLLYVLARRPETWTKLRAEALNFDITTLDRERMKDAVYLSYCINECQYLHLILVVKANTNPEREALRLHPVVPLTTRWCNKDTILPRGGGPDEAHPLLVPQGTSVYVAFYPMHRRKDIFGDDADEFRPERWATLKPGWGFTPFGGGPRICIGRK